METELKLKIAQQDMARLNDHPLLKVHAVATPSEHRLIDIYYDTPRLELWRHGFTLRVREDGESEEGTTWIQTVKTSAIGSPAPHTRGEWESTLLSAEPQPLEIARQIRVDRIAKLLRSSAVVKHLRPVFTSTTRRNIWNLMLPDGQLVECAIDAGNIVCAGQTISIGELEFEVKSGDPTLLFQLALALHEEIPLEIANDSKAARGYALLETRPAKAVKARAVHLTRKMSLEDAFRCLGLHCMEHMEANVPEVLAQSVEGLHQMRVGLRRLRALLDMFANLAPLPTEMLDGVDWLASELGATRDWDVLASSTLDRMSAADASEARNMAAGRARECHQALLISLRDPRYTQVILQMNEWLYGRHWRSAGKTPKHGLLGTPVGTAMLPILNNAQKRLAKRIDSADTRDPAAVHRVRIAAKKARYAAEFFYDLMPRGAVRKYVSRLSKLQDRLGSFNDLEVGKRLLSELVSTNPSQSATFALGYLSSELQSSIEALPKPLRDARRLSMPVNL